jgi:hypothetical protein
MIIIPKLKNALIYFLKSTPDEILYRVAVRLIKLRMLRRILGQLRRTLVLSAQNITLQHYFKTYLPVPATMRTGRAKPHLLVLRWYYRSGSTIKSEIEFSSESHFLSGSLRASGLATFEEYYYDLDYGSEKFPAGDTKLVQKCVDILPDGIILSSYNHVNMLQPRLKTIQHISENLGIPIFPFWYDSVGPKYYSSYIQKLDQFCSKHIFVDSVEEKINRPVDQKKFINLWTPIDPTVFYYDEEEVPTIPVSFLGSRSSHRSSRNEYLDYLESVGIHVIISGGTEDSRMLIEEYASNLRKSLMSINFSQRIGDSHQLKGRVFEILLCGRLLLESENNQTSKYFIPGTDYVSFRDKEDLARKIRYYLDNEEEREYIAKKGYLKALNNYSGSIFWHRIISEL